jgi:hypothetical protein
MSCLPANHQTAKQSVKDFKGLTLDFEKAIFASIADCGRQASEARIKKVMAIKISRRNIQEKANDRSGGVTRQDANRCHALFHYR